MIVNINYGNSVAVIPAAAMEHLASASLNDVKALVAIAAESGREGIDLKKLADKVGMDLGELVVSLNFWQRAGIVSMSEALQIKTDDTPAPETETPEKKHAILRKSDEIPRYTTEELSVILEKRAETSHLIDECQQVFGKMFNTHEINIVLGLVDYLALGWDYVMELLEFCAKQGKHSLNYVERTAFSFVEEGIDNVDMLKARIAELEVIKSNETFVRKLFGMKSRALTAKEKKSISRWFGEYGYGESIVSRAYELTIAATNEASVPYANAILERWHSEGIRTLEDIDKAEQNRLEANKSEPVAGSFDTDDFFEAALKRSYNKK